MFLTITQTAEYLSVSNTQIKRLMKTDDFPAPYSFGAKSYRFDKSEVDLWIKNRKVKNYDEITVIPKYKIKPIKSKKVNLQEITQSLKDFNKYGQLANGTTSSI